MIAAPQKKCEVPGTYATIADALADSSCDTINVAPGTYPEQLTISRAVTLQGANGPNNPTVIMPASVTWNSLRYGTSGYQQAAIILVTGTTGVTIKDMVVDGSAAATGSAPLFTSCAAPTFVGILISGASATIQNTVVTDLYQASPSSYGCQSDAGLGIYVQSPPSTASTASVKQDTVTNYQKNGITCNDVGTTCKIDHNTVSPLAAAQPFVASNGIQIGFGAVGSVTHNSVSGNECGTSNCGSDYTQYYQSAGILTYLSGVGTVVQDNTVSNNDVGILLAGDSVTATNNQVQDNRWEGILLNDGAYTAKGNHISGGLIGMAIVSDGFFDNPTVASIMGNHFDGSFATSPVQIVSYTGSPNGGPYSQPATITTDGGFSETVTPGSSATPSFVNLTSFPGGPPPPHH